MIEREENVVEKKELHSERRRIRWRRKNGIVRDGEKNGEKKDIERGEKDKDEIMT